MTAWTLAGSSHVVGAAILDRDRCLVAQRGPKTRLPGKWEFPGGKVETGEAPEAALGRELQEELNLGCHVGSWLGRGDHVQGGHRSCLDVYEVSAETESLRLQEHSAVRWVSAHDLYELDWADADVPVLPALRARLAESTRADRSDGPVTIISADWGKSVRKRSAYVARPAGGWTVRRLDCEDGWTLAKLLDRAEQIRRRTGTAVLIGLDVSLGVPAALARRAGATSFVDFLSWLGDAGGLDHEAESADRWRPEHPFFRVPPGSGGKTRYFDAAGGESVLVRQIEIRTRANPTFVLSGIPGSVGSGSRAVWRELAPLVRLPVRRPDFGIWPFEGDLASLLAKQAIVVAEIYPRAAYALALSQSLPTPPESIGKTQRAARQAALARLQSAAWIAAAEVDLPDLAAAEHSEDDFDALLTVAALVRAVAEDRPLSCPLVDPIAEGGLLATGDIELPQTPHRRSTARRRRSLRRETRTTARGQRPASSFRCPIPGCSMTYASGRLGWDAHVGSHRKHPDWHPELEDPEARKARYRREFPGWFVQG